jgi:hypothetical protein
LQICACGQHKESSLASIPPPAEMKLSTISLARRFSVIPPKSIPKPRGMILKTAFGELRKRHSSHHVVLIDLNSFEFKI